VDLEDTGYIYASTDSGVTWTAQGVTSPGRQMWYSVASSADGTNLVAGADSLEDGYLSGWYIYTSIDSGLTWVQRGTTLPGKQQWISVGSSADGSKLVAVAYSGYIYTSSDSGENWIQRGSLNLWQSVASSADGTKLIAVATDFFLDGGYYLNHGYIYTSTDSGETWVQRGTSQRWRAVASSADGTQLVAAVQGNGYIYTSSGSTH
jgi:photosystem II stability/assembly factor-like uncharacterized protein